MKLLALFVILFSIVNGYDFGSGSSVLCQIDFQEGFSNDTLDIKINDVEIIKDGVLNTNPDLGVTKLKFRVYQIGKKRDSIAILENYVFCPHYKSPIIQINYKGVTTTYVINLKKGKYIGINRHEKIITLVQSKTQFYYY